MTEQDHRNIQWLANIIFNHAEWGGNQNQALELALKIMKVMNL